MKIQEDNFRELLTKSLGFTRKTDDAVLNDYYDYVLLSELIREIILRLISSTVERHSEYKSQAIIGDAPNLSYNEYVAKNELDVDNNVIFSQYDNRIKLRITKANI